MLFYIVTININKMAERKSGNAWIRLIYTQPNMTFIIKDLEIGIEKRTITAVRN